LALVIASGYSQDYPIQPIPANFTSDANTTFLVNLTTAKTQADFALGNGQLSLNTNNFQVGAGYTGPIGFNTARNWPTNVWTLEMLIRMPYQSRVIASNNPIGLLDWQSNPQQCSFDFTLDPNSGVFSKMYSWNSGNGFFLSGPHAGGNTFTIQASAPDKWVYIGVGCDFGNQLYMTTAREVGGAILNSNINFIPTPGASNSAAAWSAMKGYFNAGLPASVSIGSNLIQIQAIKLSNVYRSNLFTITPLLATANANNWMPATIDPARTQTRAVSRQIGYPGFDNSLPMFVDEAYLPIQPGSAPFFIHLTNVAKGLYTFYLYGQVAPNGRTNLNQVWKPCFMNFAAMDAGGAVLAQGQMPLKQYLLPRRMQGFQFHLDSQTTNVTLTFSVPGTALETPWIQRICQFDDLAGLPDVAVKTRPTIFSGGATNQDTALTSARMQRDDAIWNSLPPLNWPIQVSAQVKAFQNPPPNVIVDTWLTKAFVGLPDYQTPSYAFSALDFLDTSNGMTFPAASILTTNVWPSPNPEAPTGVFFSRSNYPSLATDIYNTKRAELLGARVLFYLGAIMNPNAQFYGSDLPALYFTNGVVDTGHDAALALVRWAYDWPAVEANLREIRFCVMSPDLDFGVAEDGEFGGNAMGDPKIVGNQDFTTCPELFKAYDQLFPYIQNNQYFASAVHRFVPWVNTPQDVIRLLDRYLVFSTVRDVNRNLIDQSSGIPSAAGQVLGPSTNTAFLFDLTRQISALYPATGTYQEMYGAALPRSGSEYIGSFMCYALGAAEDTIRQASIVQWAKTNGVPVPMDLSDVSKYPKVLSAGNFMLDMWVAGGFPFMIGDSSGGTHSGGQAKAVLGAAGAVAALNQIYNLSGDSRFYSAAMGDLNSVLHASSRVIPDWGAVLELAPDETNLLRKTSATLRLGIGQGHSHSDYLDLNLFGMGLPLAVDLACRNEGTYWSRPGANWSFLHNHALSHRSIDPNGAGAQAGEPWLKAFAPPLVRASYNDGQGAQLDRQTFLMQVGNTNVFYAFDVQWLNGGVYHTWAFHGCESSNLVLNVPMSSQAGLPVTNRWIDRTLEGTQFAGAGTNSLQAVWTMTRAAQSFNYAFNGGGTLNTVACEPTVLGTNYNSALPPVQVRATLLGRGSDTVLQGNPYSATYQYCFPFLWCQTSNETSSVYPAVYDWYRGTPSVSSAILLATNPVRVQVTAAAQTDTYECATNYFLVVSRDTNGLRYAQLNGYAPVSLPDLTLAPAQDYAPTITSIDYGSRTVTTSGPLPQDPLVTVGNDGRQVSLQLYGSGTSFTFNDDLTVLEGQVTSLHVTGSNSIAITLNQSLLFDNSGNRHSTNMVLATEDGLWHFRNNTVIKSPANATLTTDVFSDANGDGLVDAKMYEVGEGDTIALPVDVGILRTPGGWRIKTNVPLTGKISGTSVNLSPQTDWQVVLIQSSLAPASELKRLPTQ
jgi:hypothetical protein